MPNRAKDWLKQAEKDLKHSRNALDDKDFEWACFAAQQAAEKAVKAMYEAFHIESWGHSISTLLKEFKPISIPKELMKCALFLDKLYIPTRYPNGFPSGAPTDYYTEEEGKEAIKHADKIIKFCKDKIS